MGLNLTDRVSLVLLIIVVVVGCTFIFIGLGNKMDENVPNRFEVKLEPRKYNCREVKVWGYEDRYNIHCDRIE